MSTIVLAWEEQAAATPNAIAIVDGLTGAELSYAELDAASNSVAHRLRSVFKASGDESMVAAVLIPSSTQRMVGYYACLKAGLSFCPLEAGWPPAACSKALELVRPSVLLLDKEDKNLAAYCHCSTAGVPIVCIDEESGLLLNCNVSGPGNINDTAHVIFTSGSSGDPKAVHCAHKGSLLSHRSRISPSSVLGQRFGCAVFGIWDAVAAHLHGAVAVMLPDASLRDPHVLAALLATNEVDRMLLTPTLLDTLLSCAASRAALSLLRSVTLCGELPTASLVARATQLLPASTALVNLYSSCECHDVALGDLRQQPLAQAFVLTPLAHVRIYVVGEDGQPTAVGESGSLLVGGEGLAGGYLPPTKLLGPSNAEVNDGGERFVPTSSIPSISGEGATGLVCLTGDRAKVVSRDASAGRVLQFQLEGREDAVVNVRGSLVALGAVEAAFFARFAAEATACAAVALIPCGVDGAEEIGLACVWNSTAKQPTPEAVRLALAKELPAVSVPRWVCSLGALPVDRLAGKCDRRAVAAALVDACSLNTAGGCIAREDSVEVNKPQPIQPSSSPPSPPPPPPAVRAAAGAGEFASAASIASAMEQVLQLPAGSVAAHDNFFVLGGHSVAAVSLCGVVGCRISTLIACPTPFLLSNQSTAAGGTQAHTDLHAEVKRAQGVAAAEAAEAAAAVPSSGEPRERTEAAAHGGQGAQTVLLTGVTGGLGCQLLRAFQGAHCRENSVGCLHVVCLVRAPSDAAAHARIEALVSSESSQGSSIAPPPPPPPPPTSSTTTMETTTTATTNTTRFRWSALAGDVAAPLLGLSAPRWAALANEVGCVVHCAAKVDRVAPLLALRSHNCDATARVAQLAERARASMHFVSSTASLPPLGTVAADRVAARPPAAKRVAARSLAKGGAWPAKGGAYCAALEGSMHTQRAHGGAWEGYAQSKWVSEQILLNRPEEPGTSRGTVVVHRFGSLAGDADLVAALAASVAVRALPRDLCTFEWLPVEVAAKNIANSALFPEALELEGGMSCKVEHHTHQLDASAVWEELMRGHSGAVKGERVETSEWVRRIEQGTAEGGAVAREVSSSVVQRIGALLALPSGLQGAVGLCECPLAGRGEGDLASCVSAVKQAMAKCRSRGAPVDPSEVGKCVRSRTSGFVACE